MMQQTCGLLTQPQQLRQQFWEQNMWDVVTPVSQTIEKVTDKRSINALEANSLSENEWQLVVPATKALRMLFLYFSSAFNTVIPSKLITKLTDLGITLPICNWLLNFLTNRPQHVWLDHRCSSILTINTDKPHGCVLSPFLYSLFTHYCRPVHSSNDIIKFADNITVIGLIQNNDELAFGEEVDRLAMWCEDNNLLLNTYKTKELIVVVKRNAATHLHININGVMVDHVTSLKFLGSTSLRTSLGRVSAPS